MTLRRSEVTVGDHLPAQKFLIARADLVRYAGASGDFNPIHWSQETAVSVGLPDVIAHGMFTMAVAIRVVTDWAADPGAVLTYSVKFSRPVVVAADRPTELVVEATVTSVDDCPDGSGSTAQIELKATVDGKTVLGKARALVRLEADR